MPQTYDLAAARVTPPVSRHLDIACRNADPRLFFPSSGVKPVEALELCGKCPHSDECLAWALDTGQGHGVWGGKTAEDRRRIRSTREAS